MASNSWWQMTVEQVTESLQTSINNGLSSEESRQRLQNTSNVLDEGKKANRWFCCSINLLTPWFSFTGGNSHFRYRRSNGGCAYHNGNSGY
jgi:magnesium-transporting ATPase (P-type)